MNVIFKWNQMYEDEIYQIVFLITNLYPESTLATNWPQICPWHWDVIVGNMWLSLGDVLYPLLMTLQESLEYDFQLTDVI